MPRGRPPGGRLPRRATYERLRDEAQGDLARFEAMTRHALGLDHEQRPQEPEPPDDFVGRLAVPLPVAHWAVTDRQRNAERVDLANRLAAQMADAIDPPTFYDVGECEPEYEPEYRHDRANIR